MTTEDRVEWMKSRRAVQLQFVDSGEIVTLFPRSFSSGAVGFHGNTKVTLPSGDRCQCNLLMVVIGSKGGEQKATGEHALPPPEISPLFPPDRQKGPKSRRKAE